MNRRGRAIMLCLVGSLVGGAGAAAEVRHDRSAVRAMARRYVHAVAVGDGKTACALLSKAGLADGGYNARTACARDYSSRPLHKEFPIIRVTVNEHHHTATAVIGDAAISDSGN